MIPLALLLAAVDAPVALPPDERMTRMRTAFDDLKCEVVVSEAAFVENDKRTTPEQMRETLFRDGYCEVVLGNNNDASERFRAALRDDAEANPPFDLEPRVQSLLDAARTDARAEARKALMASVLLDVTPPQQLVGGARAVFLVKLTDPRGAAKSMRIDFKKEGEREYYGLPIVKTADGTWRGEVPGTYTRTRAGIMLNWYITASDDAGPLASVGTKDAPRKLFVGSGAVVAQDLKANERLPHWARLMYAGLGAPVMAASGFFAATGVLEFGALGASDGPDFLLAVLPPFMAALGTAATTFTLLDGWMQWVPTAVVGGIGALYAAQVLFLGVLPLSPRRTPDAALFLTAAAGVVAAGAVSATLVAFDEPQLE